MLRTPPPYYTFFRLEGDEPNKQIGDYHGEEALGDPMNTKAIYGTIESSCYYYSISKHTDKRINLVMEYH